MKWPQRIIDSLGREPQVGDWYAECCILDFHQIEDAEALSGLLELQDELDTGGRFWATEAEARAELEAEESCASPRYARRQATRRMT